VQPAATRPLTPLVLYGAILARWLLAERVIAATLSGDARYLLQTYLADHKTTSFEQAREALAALVEAPWNSEMAAHYQGSPIEQLRERAHLALVGASKEE
jgi:alpha-galactosidase/6-phospho-beta-glucosidase family protein